MCSILHRGKPSGSARSGIKYLTKATVCFSKRIFHPKMVVIQDILHKLKLEIFPKTMEYQKRVKISLVIISNKGGKE